MMRGEVRTGIMDIMVVVMGMGRNISMARRNGLARRDVFGLLL